MHIQIEVTTICNYQCFYCAGRDMPQRHMDMELFKGILKRIPPGQHRVSLQGEGEPTMHPHFWEMVEMVKQLGHTPYTITNGSIMDPAQVIRFFPRIGISIDTIDPDEAHRIKRYKLRKVLKNLESLLKVYEARRIVIHTVDYGQDIKPLKSYLAGLGITKHVVQPLQVKDDYAYRYKELAAAPQKACSYNCEFVNSPIMRYYSLNGVEMPCCYIKDTSKFVSIEDIKQSLDNQIVPPACAGCGELYKDEKRARIFQV